MMWSYIRGAYKRVKSCYLNTVCARGCRRTKEIYGEISLYVAENAAQPQRKKQWTARPWPRPPRWPRF